jgi:hypothetical protein
MSSDEARTRTRDVVLVDQVRHSPVDRAQMRKRRKLILWVALAVVVIAVALFLRRFNLDRAARFEGPEEHFKYGSIGSEPGGPLKDAAGGLLPPYHVFKVLPQVCADRLPGGYASLGLVSEPGHDLPIGVSRRYRLGFDQVGLNCAVCHTGTVRETAESPRQVFAGMPSHQLDLQGFFRFVLDCVLDERFTADNVLGRIAASGTRLGPLDRFLYRYVVIPRTREQTLRLERRLARLMGNELPDWGPGRVDTFNPYKGMQFNWQLRNASREELTGASDFPPLWNQAPREGLQLHWDGNNTSVDERNLSASLGAGVTPVTIDHGGLRLVKDWIMVAPPPRYPFAIDATRAERGRVVYAAQCFECHADHRFREGGGGKEGTRVGTVVPIEQIGTDPFRLKSYTYEFAANQYTLYPNSPYRFKHFRKTNGYANQPLDGIWARAPYLHNGSVPTLRALLDPPAQRPAEFYRGYDVFDQANVGFVSTVESDGGRRFFKFDTTLDGNGKDGHLYGTTLAAADKDAIVEYMKTF